jgi:hypothetical protein
MTEAGTDHQPPFPDVGEAFMALIRWKSEFGAREQSDLIQQPQRPEAPPEGMRGVALIEAHPDLLGFRPDVAALDRSLTSDHVLTLALSLKGDRPQSHKAGDGSP